MRRTFSQVSRSFPWGGVNQIPANAAVLAADGGAVKSAWQLLLAPCRLFHVLAPPLALRCTQMQGRLEQASRSQLGAVAKVQVFVSFDIGNYTSN